MWRLCLLVAGAAGLRMGKTAQNLMASQAPAAFDNAGGDRMTNSFGASTLKPACSGISCGDYKCDAPFELKTKEGTCCGFCWAPDHVIRVDRHSKFEGQGIDLCPNAPPKCRGPGGQAHCPNPSCAAGQEAHCDSDGQGEEGSLCCPICRFTSVDMASLKPATEAMDAATVDNLKAQLADPKQRDQALAYMAQHGVPQDHDIQMSIKQGNSGGSIEASQKTIASLLQVTETPDVSKEVALERQEDHHIHDDFKALEDANPTVVTKQGEPEAKPEAKPEPKK
jgi:hypothetical protein